MGDKQKAREVFRGPSFLGVSEYFQEKWNPVFRPEIPKNKDLERFSVSMKQ
ncbi:hypothetical protein [Rhizobium paknamense]|uniref:Uncharacterized protein n=1 Tax=Rhizobium paknamense TaxID=1206817 RepID=A0ABU0I9W7_9HYPH|nr:hypothetical protein [Rhizobium paknamense]MDQ0454418.1 hypothetical protein [Rhizobium paknamense]